MDTSQEGQTWSGGGSGNHPSASLEKLRKGVLPDQKDG